jgi:hypothetical protein
MPSLSAVDADRLCLGGATTLHARTSALQSATGASGERRANRGSAGARDRVGGIADSGAGGPSGSRATM